MSRQAKPKDSNPIRPRPHAVGLLRYYGLSVRQVSLACGRYQQQVQNALDIPTFKNAPFSTVLEVRATTERLLRAAGWKGEPAELWGEYDAALRERSAA